MKSIHTVLYPLLAAWLLVGVGCQSKASDKKPGANQAVATRISAAGLKASCPFLTQDQAGNPVMCWVQAQDTSGNFLLSYSRSEDGGLTFGKPSAIPTTQGVYPHDENLSKLIFKKNGEMLAVFGVSNPSPENSYAGLIKYTQSFDGGKTWTAARQLAIDSLNSKDQRYFDVALLPNGEVAAIWLDARKNTPKEGSSLYFATTTGQQGFTQEKAIDQQLCQCCRTDLFVDGQGQVHAAYRAILQDSIRDMMHLVSVDNGQTFAPRERISPDNWAIDGCPHTGPTLAWTKTGLHAAWYTMGGGSGVFYSQKTDEKPFAPREQVSSFPSARHPQLTAYGSENLALVWDELIPSSKDFQTRIGLQLKDQNGRSLQRAYLTPATVKASYPVVLPTSNNSLVIAYTQKTDTSSEVWYQRVDPHQLKPTAVASK
ncbi:hypothetical protein GU926_03560 [Nibribacter ruber]|uniref:Sialidase domain-containing protein n=1 Tax=Nibribacter ruber TaxID=2698458 RepID=A0A6P1NXI8_9BACT|nr:sialidase family protein [Nibribacter ruber]QHL86565.1 hypothetical protein GU926_03560 [Nibribacter ruber]